MKKITALCLAAVLLLTGCETDSVPDYPQYSSFSNISGGQTGSSTAEGSVRLPEESTSSRPFVSDKDLRHITVSLTNDIRNARTLTIDGDVLTVVAKNGDWKTNSVRIGSIAFSARKEGSTTIFTLDGSRLRKGYVTLELWGDEEIVSYRLKHDENGYSFPDVMELSYNNFNAIMGAADLTNQQTLKYITKDGTAANADAVLRKIRQLSNKICRGQKTEYDKLRAISQWVSKNIYYDNKAYKAGIPDECLTLEYMLERGASVCGGYAAMTSALCEVQGITCLHVKGYGITQSNCYAELNNGVAHEWNYAIIGGKGIWIDSGWNSRSYFYDVGSYTQDDIVYTYFDVSNEVFALDHKAVSAQLRNYFPD